MRPKFKVCAGEKGYEGSGHSREAWRHQEATQKQLRSTLEGVSWEAKMRRLKGEILIQWGHRNVLIQRGTPECWDGDGRHPGRQMTLCGRRRCWDGDGRRPGGRMKSCGS